MKALIGVLLLAALVFSDPWSPCGTPKDHLKIKSMTIDPPQLSAGKPFTIKFDGTLDKAITSGNAHIEVKYLGVKVFSKDYSICDFAESKCPIQAGEIQMTQTETMPSVVPKGTYSGLIQAWDQDKQMITCVTFQMKVVVGMNDPVVSDELIDAVNLKSDWTAEKNKFSGMTFREAQKYLGARLVKSNAPVSLLHLNALPTEFDSRTQWPSCIHPIRDQGQCGSCWAFALSEVVGDRFCIASHAATNEVLSPQYIVSCDKTDYACQGGYIDKSWAFMENTGTVTEKCWSYKSGGGSVPACRTTCEDGSALKFYKVKKGTTVNVKGEANIQTEVMTNGPVEAGFTVYQDFFSYKGGVYRHVSGGQVGGHAVKVVGWGVESGTNYWMVANSWNTSWGLQGFFKILRGKNECDFETYIYAGAAAV